jgi:hypothetical protein
VIKVLTVNLRAVVEGGQLSVIGAADSQGNYPTGWPKYGCTSWLNLSPDTERPAQINFIAPGVFNKTMIHGLYFASRDDIPEPPYTVTVVNIVATPGKHVVDRHWQE